ncbi:MAG: hypothetical protein IKE27_10180 [Oscillospiraceae bacterium]|nr:hypothetical protein [Oscillospiraceae bacterium]
MKKRLRNIINRQIDRKALIALLALLALLRLLATAFQRFGISPEMSILDDYLMYNGARSIAEGSWLGGYSYMTIGKHMFFSCWLAMLHGLHIPYIFAGHVMHVLSCTLCLIAVWPAIGSDVLKLVSYVALLFNPASFSTFVLRVYRDNVSTSFAIAVFAAVIGIALRLGKEHKAFRAVLDVVGGICLGISWIIREDGYWIVPFAAAAFIVMFIYLVAKKQKVLGIIADAAVLIIFAVVPIILFAFANLRTYGVFTVSDFTGKEFSDAYGAVTRVIDESEDTPLIVPVTEASREKLYSISPSFAELEPYLENDQIMARWKKDCGNGVVDYSGGGFYWAIRNAASLAGYHETPEKAREYYSAVADEINAACDQGTVEARSRRSALNAPIEGKYIVPTLKEAVSSLFTVIIYKDLDSSPDLSLGSPELISEIEEFVGSDAMRTTRVPIEGTYSVEAWAVSEYGPVDMQLVNGDGTVSGSQRTISTAGDVYLQFLQNGKDYPYTNGARSTFTGEGSPDGMLLVLSVGDRTATADLGDIGTVREKNGIVYKIEAVGPAYDETIEYGFFEIWLYRGLRVLTYAYGILNPVILVVALYSFARLLVGKNRELKDHMTVWVLVGIILSAALRIGMIAFAETSAFGIGTYPMYLASVYPLMILFEILAIGSFASKTEKVK